MGKSIIKDSEMSVIKNSLDRDYYKGDNKNIIQNLLRKIKPFKDYPVEKEIPLELIEKLVYKYECKYALMINYICPVFIKGEKPMYSVSFKYTDDLTYAGTIYGSSLYEAFCKVALYYYLTCNLEQRIGLKDWSKK